MFPSAHETPTRQDALLDLGQMYLHHHAFLARLPVADFGHTVTWPADFQEDLPLDVALRRGNHQLGVFGIAGGTAREICLMLFALCVGEVRALVRMQCQTQAAFEGAQVIAENIRILGGQRGRVRDSGE